MKLFTISIPVAFFVFVIMGCGNPAAEQKNQSTPAAADADSNKLLSVKNMQDDLLLLWSAIQEVHPGYGFYTPADSLQKIYEKTSASIRSPLSESQFIDIVYPFLCQLRCGHTQLKHSATYKPSIGQLPHLPFHVLVRHHKAWITMHGTEQMNTGDEIISINGVPAAEIIDHGYDLYCGDGYTETFKELFLSEYDGFEDACNKYYHWTGPYQIKLLGARGHITNITANPTVPSPPANPISQKTVNNFSDWTVFPAIPDDRLRFLNSSPIAFLKIPPFAYPDTAVYKAAFKAIQEKGIKELILDMRHNSGGDIRIAIQLLSYLADSSFNIVNDVKSRLPNPSLNHFSAYFDTSITSNFTVGYKTSYQEHAWHHVDVTPDFGRLYGPFALSEEAHFNGNLVVLIDGATFSSGALFTAALKTQRKNVKFVGRETAGSEEGCNGMTIQKLTLPHTKIVVDFPWMRVVSVAKKPVPGRGIMPDFYIDYPPEDIVTDNDLDVRKALTLLK